MGKDKVDNRITPAGAGKSSLDGMFGRTNVVLAKAMDGGISYYDSSTICAAIESSNGLASTQFARYQPDRTRKLEVSLNGISLESVLLTSLDPDRPTTQQTSLAFKHSSYGSGLLVDPNIHIEFGWRTCHTSGKGSKKKDDYEIIEGIYNNNVSTIESARTIIFDVTNITISIKLFQGSINVEVVNSMRPMHAMYEARKNARAWIQAKQSKAGEGAGNFEVRSQKQKTRV